MYTPRQYRFYRRTMAEPGQSPFFWDRHTVLFWLVLLVTLPLTVPAAVVALVLWPDR